MALFLITSEDGKRRMLLNPDLVFAYMENDDGTVNALSVTGALLVVPLSIEDVAAAMKEVETD